MKQSIQPCHELINNLVGKIEKEHSLFYGGEDNNKMKQHNLLPHNVLQWFEKVMKHYLDFNKIKEYKHAFKFCMG